MPLLSVRRFYKVSGRGKEAPSSECRKQMYPCKDQPRLAWFRSHAPLFCPPTKSLQQTLNPKSQGEMLVERDDDVDVVFVLRSGLVCSWVRNAASFRYPHCRCSALTYYPLLLPFVNQR